MSQRPRKLRRRHLLAGLTALSVLLSGIGLVRLWGGQSPGEVPGSAQVQLQYLNKKLSQGADIRAQETFPEGLFFMNAMYGLAWTQLAVRHPEDAALRKTAVTQASYALNRLQSPAGTSVFTESLSPAHGIFYQGWTNWLRGSILVLQPAAERNPYMVQNLKQASAAITAALKARPFPVSYPARSWPVDSAVAVASLALADKVSGKPEHRGVIANWLKVLRAHIDKTTGLIPHEVDPVRGVPIAGPRGGSMALLIRFVAEVDPNLAKALHRSWASAFLAAPMGLGPAVREYPVKVNGDGDIDSGPLVMGVSLSASTVALASARAVGDARLARALSGEAELVGGPIQLPGSKRYAFGMVPIGEAFLIWSQTSVLMTRGQPADPPQVSLPGLGRGGWTLWLLVLPLLLGLATAVTWLRVRRPDLLNRGPLPELFQQIFRNDQPADRSRWRRGGPVSDSDEEGASEGSGQPPHAGHDGESETESTRQLPLVK